MSESLHDALVFEVALLPGCLDACLVLSHDCMHGCMHPWFASAATQRLHHKTVIEYLNKCAICSAL